MNLSVVLEDDYFDYSLGEYSNLAVPKLLVVLVSVVGWIGNMLICYVIAFNKHMHTNTNCYLFSLATSDGFLQVALLFDCLYRAYTGYIQNDDRILHTINKSIGITSSTASIVTAIALTVDRYIAVCHPFLARSWFNGRRTIRIILSVWAVVLPYSIGLAICSDGRRKCFCVDLFPLFTLETYVTLFFFIPMVCFIVFYTLIGFKISKSEKMEKHINIRNSNSYKSIQMSVAVVAEFCICWGPVNILAIVYKYYKPFRVQEGKHIFIYVSHVLYLISTFMNPVTYCIMSTTFRKSFKDILCSSGVNCKHKSTNHKTREINELLAVGYTYTQT